ncbi:Uncharacterized protein PBTT_07143 [Plasmodiophora brassicae]
MLSRLPLLAVAFAIAVNAQSGNVALTNGQGTITASGLQFSPCSDQTFTFPPSVPAGLNDQNANVVITITYTYTAASSSQIIASKGVLMTVTLMKGTTACMQPLSITFMPTTNSNPNTVSFTVPTVARFDSISFGAQQPAPDTCLPSQLTAPGITGFAPVDVQLAITVGQPNNNGVTQVATNQGQVVAYEGGQLQGSFTCPPWGNKTYSFDKTEIVWLPCAYSGLTFYDTAKKYAMKSVVGVTITLHSDEDVTLSLRLHSVGVSRDVFQTMFHVTAGTAYQTVTIPVPGAGTNVIFDQVLIAESQGMPCAQAQSIYIQKVAIAGLPSLPNDYTPSNNGVVNTGSGANGQAGGGGGAHSGAGDILSRNLLTSTMAVNLLALAALHIV